VRYLRGALCLVGVALFGVLIAENDPAAILESIRSLSWRLGLLLVFPTLPVVAVNVLGWRYAFARDRARFGQLFWVRTAGEAFNTVTPTASMGGEMVKVWLLRGRVPVEESLPSVIIAKTTITVAQGLLLLVGLVLAWELPMSDARLLVAMQWLLGIEVLALGGFVLVQTRGMLGWSGRLLQRFGLPLHRVAILSRADDGLARFYRTHPVRLGLSLTYHFAGWMLGAIEVYLILLFLDAPVSLLTATVIEALGTGIRFATFFIPASVGALEGGYAATFVALGFSSTLGVSFSLVRRIREAVWVAIGLLAFAVMRPRHEATTSEPLAPKQVG
jgi:uncharacterized protein (TIRG00374 family)